MAIVAASFLSGCGPQDPASTDKRTLGTDSAALGPVCYKVLVGRLDGNDPNNNRLYPDFCLQSPQARYFLMQQWDGNLVEYDRQIGRALWASNTYNSPNQYMFTVMQSDANLVQYSTATLTARWSSNTGGHANIPKWLEVQDDGNAVIYDQDDRGQTFALWSTRTGRLY